MESVPGSPGPSVTSDSPVPAGELQKMLDECTQAIQELHLQIAELEELVQKQKRTISHQSKVISDPRVHRAVPIIPLFPLTPQHPGPSLVASPFTPQSGLSPGSSIFDRPPPRFSLSESPDPFAPSPGPNSTNQPKEGCNCPHICALFDTDTTISTLSIRFRNLYQRTEIWGYTHANVPQIRKDSRLDAQKKEYLIALADRSQVSALLGDTSTRYYLVAKALNYYLVQEILKISVARLYDSLEVDLRSANTPLMRQLAILATVSRTKDVIDHPGFQTFYQEKCSAHVAKLWQYVGPLCCDSFETSSTAWQELGNIVREAQSLAIDMQVAPLEYHFDFPEPNESFEPTTMINHDRYIRGDPTGLKNQDFRVKLGVSPITRIRNHAVRPAEVRVVFLGGVLLRPR
ncbi:hypothetical protein EYZ11_002729 [Aspergillus tanneri]|uniref:Uncharacterized protein n=1 Tax=Aspergillus tanneri TaxID=1220188 RepID=A0A4S3JQ29_9EURO|nr:hypothetical protein EYZ11_002729 [Aspergillus tanneri]